MKSLFKRLFNAKKQDQKTFDLSWMDGLSDLDDLSAVQSITQHLTLLTNDGTLSREQRALALLHIDTHSHVLMDKITTQYVKFDHLRPELEARFWETAYYYYRHLFTAYFNAVFDSTHPEKSSTLGTVQLETVIWSCLHAGSMMNKWRYFKRLPAPDKTWLQIFKLLQLAEQQALLEIPIQISEDEPGSSIGESLIQAFMLDSLLETGMSKNHLETSQQLLKIWLKNSRIYKSQNNNKFIFYVDITQDRGARRLRELAATPDFRFWDTTLISNRISTVQATIANKESLKIYGLGEIADSPTLSELLQLLDTAWSNTMYQRQRRKEKRIAISKPVMAVYGIEHVLKLMRQISNQNVLKGAKGIGNDKSFEDRLASHHVGKPLAVNQFFEKGNEQWIIVNESEQGCGALVNNNLDSNLKIENLVGLVTQDSHKEVMVGVIKNIKPLPNNQLRIGIYIFTRKAYWVEMSLLECKPQNQLLEESVNINTSIIDNLYPEFFAIYLSPENGITKTPSLLIPRLEFQQNSFYQITLHGEKLRVQLDQILDAKNDWVRVNYPLTGNESG